MNFKVGNRVKFVAGPYKGLKGTVEKVTKDRVTVELSSGFLIIRMEFIHHIKRIRVRYDLSDKE